MIRMFAFYHTFLKVSGQIIFDDHTVEDFVRGQKLALEKAVFEKKDDYINKMLDFDLYYLGEYDDEKLIIKPDKQLLLSCREVVTACEFRLGGKEDDKKKKSVLDDKKSS